MAGCRQEVQVYHFSAKSLRKNSTIPLCPFSFARHLQNRHFHELAGAKDFELLLPGEMCYIFGSVFIE